jgi:hypothetical protein
VGLKLPRKIETTRGGVQELGLATLESRDFFRPVNALFLGNSFSASNGFNLAR